MKLFLDIDGVMVHANPSKSVDFEDDGFYKFNVKAVTAINTIKHKISNVEIVLSTSHRHRYSIVEWENIFRRRGVSFNEISIVETIQNHSNSRKVEIEQWIKHKNYDFEEVIIIDDDKSLNGLPQELKCRLVLTNSYIGLSNASELTEVLKY